MVAAVGFLQSSCSFAFRNPHPFSTFQTSAVLTMVAAPFSGWLKAVLTVVARPRWLLLIIFVLMDCYASVLLLTFGPKYIEVRGGSVGGSCRKICMRSFTSVLVINPPHVDMRSAHVRIEIYFFTSRNKEFRCES